MLYLLHSNTVLRRWAIIIIEALENLVLIVSWISASVSTSTDAVTSSITNILDCLKRALPKHKSCFCPTLKFSLPSEMKKFKPSWKDETKVLRWQSSKHFQICSSEYWFQGSRLKRIEPAKRIGSCFKR